MVMNEDDVPRLKKTVAELKYLASVLDYFTENINHISLVRDFQLNRITDDGVYLNRDEMMNILIYLDTFDGVLPNPN